jgi:hypothetical protein
VTHAFDETHIMNATPTEPTSPLIFSKFPSVSGPHLIQRWGPRSDSRLSYEFAASARRLAGTHVGQPVDDEILLPMMYLYRHALELALKEAIQLAAYIRRSSGDEDSYLSSDAVTSRLMKEHRHSIGALVNELNRHLTRLELSELPAGANRVLQYLADADSRGESFRYTGTLAETGDNIDLPSLVKALDGAYAMVSATTDMLEAFEESQSEWLGVQREMKADYEAEMRSEFGY